MTLPLFLEDAKAGEYTIADIAQIIREQQAYGRAHNFTQADQLRSAAMYCPRVMMPAQWVEAATSLGIHEGTARNRLNEVRKQQIEDDKITAAWKTKQAAK